MGFWILGVVEVIAIAGRAQAAKNTGAVARQWLGVSVAVEEATIIGNRETFD